jgi:hypothetical protein
VTVWYSTLEGTGSKGAKADVDYEATKGSIVIPAGQTQGQIEVPIFRDTTYEADEWFTVQLDVAQNAAVDKAHSHTKGIIKNDDPLPSVSINDVALAEGSPEDPPIPKEELRPAYWQYRWHTMFLFTVTLSNPSSETVKVWFSTIGGTAIPEQDYVPWKESKTGPWGSWQYPYLTIAPGKTTFLLPVFVKRDSSVESDETFGVKFRSATNATILDDYGVGTILNDDGPGAQNAAISHDAAVNELAGPGQLAAYFEPLGRRKGSERATDLILATQ